MKDQDEQYRSDANLRARVETHQRYTVGPELEPAVDAALALLRSDAIVDVGTGYGDFPARLARGGHHGLIVGVDVQPGMIEVAHQRHAALAQFLRADVQQLPFDDDRFNAVTARHMLYHVADIPAALQEARRILRHGGRFLAVTNAHDNMNVFWEVVAETMQRFPGLRKLSRGSSGLRFTDLNAPALIGDTFGNVQESRLYSRLEFPSPEPVERYFRSCLPGFDIDDPDEAAAVFRAALEARWPASGPWTVDKTLLIHVAMRSY